MSNVPGRSAMTAPYPEKLCSEAWSKMDAELRRFERAVTRQCKELRDIEAQIQLAEDLVGRRKRDIDVATEALTEEELLPRSPYEATRAALLRPRREVMRSRRIRLADDALARQQRQLDDLWLRREERCNAIGQSLDLARRQALRIRDHVAVRITTYWDGVMQTHVDGRHLALRVERPEVPLPAWVTAPYPCCPGLATNDVSAPTADHGLAGATTGGGTL